MLFRERAGLRFDAEELRQKSSTCGASATSRSDSSSPQLSGV